MRLGRRLPRHGYEGQTQLVCCPFL